jgi:hypothetical protein
MEHRDIGGVTTTEVCNISCVMCHFNGPQALRKEGTLTPGEVRKFVSSVPKGPLWFASTGEFLMDPNAFEHLRIAVEYGHEPRVLTNGLLLTPQTVDRMLEIGVRHIAISVDAYQPDQYRKIRRGGELSTIVDACLYLRSAKQRYPEIRVEINNVLFRKTVPLQDRFVDFWRGKVDVVNFNAEYYDTFKFRNTLFEPGERVDCQMRVFLLPNGQMSPCCAITVHQHTNNLAWLPHIRDTSPGEALERFKTLYADASSPLGQLCPQCDWWILFKQNQKGETPYIRSVPLDDGQPRAVGDPDGLIEVPGVLSLADSITCQGANVRGTEPTTITTAAERWSYAALFPLRLNAVAWPAHAPIVVRVDAELDAGGVGIAITNQRRDAFVSSEEHVVESGGRTIYLRIEAPMPGLALVVRNIYASPSRVTLTSIRTFAKAPFDVSRTPSITLSV